MKRTTCIQLLFIGIWLLISGTLGSQGQTVQGTITGTVKDQQNKPMADVSVGLYSQNAVVKETHTDKDGAYSIREISLGTYTLGVDAGEGFLRSDSIDGPQGRKDLLRPDLTFTPDSNRKEYHFIIEPAPRIKGVVLDEEGKPLAGAIVSSTAMYERFLEMLEDSTLPGNTMRKSGGLVITSPTTTAEDGSFILFVYRRVKSMNILAISAIHRHHELAFVPQQNYAWSQETTVPEIRMTKARLLFKGTVYDAKSREPIPNLNMTMTYFGLQRFQSLDIPVQVDAQGHFEVTVPDGQYRFTFDDYEDSSHNASPPLGQILQQMSEYPIYVVPKAQKSEKTFLFTGKVISADDTMPIHSASIELVNREGDSTSSLIQTYSAPQGTFKMDIPQSAVANNTKLVIFAQDYDLSEIPFSNFTEHENVTISLKPKGGKLQVYLDSKESFANGLVWVTSLGRFENKEIPMHDAGRSLYINKIDPEWSPVIVWAANERYAGRSEIISITEQAEVPQIVIPLHEGRPHSHLNFQVQDAKTGQPIKAAKILLEGIGMRFEESLRRTFVDLVTLATLTDSKGTAQINKVPLFAGKIKVSQGLYQTYEQPFECTGDGINQTLTIKMNLWE